MPREGSPDVIDPSLPIRPLAPPSPPAGGHALDPRLDALTRDVAALQRANARLRRLSIGAVLVAVIAALASATDRALDRSRSRELTVAALEAERLVLRGPDGAARIEAGVDPSGRATVRLTDAGGALILGSGEGAIRGPHVALVDPGGTRRALLCFSGGGDPVLTLRDANGRSRLSLDMISGAPGLLLQSADADSAIWIGESEDGATRFFRFMDRQKKVRAELGMDGEGRPRFRLRDETGRVTHEVP